MKIFFFILISFSFIFAKTVKLTSLEWPPYSGQNLPEKGMSILIAKKAFLAAGYELEIDFFPWMRAVAVAQKIESYDGYMPEYYEKHLEESCYFSDSIGESILGFVEPKERPVTWQKLADLQNYTIGTVRGYVNAYEFDKMAKEGLIRTDASVNDLQNIQKVLYERVDAAIIDKYVLEHFLSRDSTVALYKNSIQFNPRALQVKSLHLCFKKTEEGKELVKIFNKGLQKIDIKNTTNEYLKKLN